MYTSSLDTEVTRQFSSQFSSDFNEYLREYRNFKRRDLEICTWYDRMEKINTSFQNVVQTVNRIPVV